MPQTSITAPTLTVMQGFEAKNKWLCAYPSPFLRTASILQILPFDTIATQVQIEPGCDGWKLSTITTTLCSLQQYFDKMSNLNQMHEKKAIQGYASMQQPT